MKEKYDVIIIGGSIAGVSAALTATNRGKSTAVITNSTESSSLYKAEKITNYPGIPAATGKEIADILNAQLAFMGGAVILAAGITREKLYPGEGEFLGRGVSYCATCDGMLYRGKRVALIGNNEESDHDAAFLEKIGCTVLRFRDNARYEIRGGIKADTVVIGGTEHNGVGVFIIKDTVSVTKLVPGLEYAAGVFAAGDCTGKPYQLAKAAGEGNVAALSACEYIDKKEK